MMFGVLQYVKRHKTKTLYKTSTGIQLCVWTKWATIVSSASRSRYYVEACVFSYLSSFLCSINMFSENLRIKLYGKLAGSGPFRRFPTRVWQNARVNIVRRVMVCDVYLPFPKILQLY